MSSESDTAVVTWMMASSGNEELPTIEDFLNRPLWMESAACRGMDVNLFFPARGQSVTAAKAVCENCLVLFQCLDYVASFTDTPAGFWAGTSERQRKRFGSVA